MNRFILIRIIGLVGVLLVVGGCYLLWSTPLDAGLEEVTRRTRVAILMTLFGNLMVLFYIFKR